MVTFLSFINELLLPRSSFPFSAINDSFGLSRMTNESVSGVESIFAELRRRLEKTSPSTLGSQ